MRACVRVCLYACVRAFARSYVGDSEGSLLPDLFATLGPLHMDVRVRAIIPVCECACLSACATA